MVRPETCDQTWGDMGEIWGDMGEARDVRADLALLALLGHVLQVRAAAKGLLEPLLVQARRQPPALGVAGGQDDLLPEHLERLDLVGVWR